MAKVIYAYFNAQDLSQVVAFMIDHGAALQDIQLKALPAISPDAGEYSIYTGCDAAISFTPCVFMGGVLQCGRILLLHDNNPEACALFAMVKKHIVSNFQYSKANALYYGPGIYHDWLDHKYVFSVLLEQTQIDVGVEHMKAVFDWIMDAGFKIKTNCARLRNIDVLDLDADCFIIHSDSGRLLLTILRKSIIRYEYGSECIFVFRDRKKQKCSFVLDERLIRQRCADVLSLYERISRRIEDGSF